MTSPTIVLLVSLLFRVTLIAIAGWVLVVVAARFRSRLAMFGAAFTIIAAALLTPLAFLQLPDSWSMKYAVGEVQQPGNGNEIVATENSDSIAQATKDHSDSSANSVSEPLQEDAAFFSSFVANFDWQVVAESESTGDAPKPANSTTANFSWMSLVIVSAVAAMSLFGVARFCFGWVGVQLLIRRSKPIKDPRLLAELRKMQSQMQSLQHVRVYESLEVSSPLTVGVFRAAIVLPSHWPKWNTAQLRSALAHELAHIQSHDFFIALMSQAALSVHYYHPLLHWLYGQLRLQQEYIADSVASRYSGGADAYVHSLASLALESQPPKAFAAVRPFLPSVGVLMRRVSMLKTQPNSSRRFASGTLVFPTGVAILVFALATAAFGIRFTAAPHSLMADDGVKPKTPTLKSPTEDDSGEGKIAKAPKHELTNLTDDGGLVIAVRPIDLLAALKMKDKKATAIVDGLAAKLYPGLSAKDVEQLAIVLSSGSKSPAPEAALVRTKSQHDYAEFMTAWSSVGQKSQLEKYTHNGKTYYESPFAEDLLLGFWQADDRTLLVDAPSDIRRRIDGKSMKTQLLDIEWKRYAQSSHFAVAATGEFIGNLASGRRFEDMHDPGDRLVEENIAIFGKNVDKAYLSVNVKTDAHLMLFIICHGDEAAREVAAAVESSIRFGRKGVRESLARIKTENGVERKAGESALTVVADVLADLSVEVEGATITVRGSAPVKDFIGAQLAAALSASQVAAHRTQSMNNLKQIAIAMHNYHDTNGHLPPPVVKGEKGQVHSWRVALLPYIEGEAVYKKYRFDEPWDSEANKALIPLMPEAYRLPGDKLENGETPYQVVVGDRTMFPKVDRAIGFRDIIDGTSNTIMTIETNPKVIWTKPDDMTYDLKKLAELGKIYKGGYVVGMGDGSVKFISSAIDEDLLKNLLMRDDGNAIPKY